LERNILIEKIVGFCFQYQILDDTSITENELKTIVEKRLEEAHFLESLINAIILRTKKTNDIDIELVKELLLELEKIRLEVEYKAR